MYSGTPLIQTPMDKKKNWPYYRDRVKFHDLRAVITNTPYITFAPLKQLVITKTTWNFPQGSILTAARLPGATKHFLWSGLDNWNFCENCRLTRLSQGPSLLISGSGSWPQREGLLSPAAGQIYRRNFPPVGFIQSPTVLLMRRQSNTITSQETWPVYCLQAVFRSRFIAFNQVQSLSGHFIFLHLSTLPRLVFPGSHGAKKHYQLVLFWVLALHTYIFSMVYGNLATSLKRLESELTKYHKMVWILWLTLGLHWWEVTAVATLPCELLPSSITGISRKAVRKNTHQTIPKGNRDMINTLFLTL